MVPASPHGESDRGVDVFAPPDQRLTALQPAAPPVPGILRILAIGMAKSCQDRFRAALSTAVESQIVFLDRAGLAQALAVHAAAPALAVVDCTMRDAGLATLILELGRAGLPWFGTVQDVSAETRTWLLTRGAADYVVVPDGFGYDRLAAAIADFVANRACSALVIGEAAETARRIAATLLGQGFGSVTAASAVATEVLAMTQASLRLAVIGPDLPLDSARQWIERLRPRSDVPPRAIIALADSADAGVALLKFGADDVLIAPWSPELLAARVGHALRGQRLEQRLRESAGRDPLTGLHNRRFLFEAGAGLIASRRRGQLALTMAVIDIDGMREINDTYGHDAGDAVIRRVATVLAQQCRRTDLVARLDGEEFALLSVNLGDAEPAFFQRLRRMIESVPVRHHGQDVPFTVSIGVCAVPQVSLDAMLEVADRMLEQAKAGPERIAAYRESA